MNRSIAFSDCRQDESKLTATVGALIRGTIRMVATRFEIDYYEEKGFSKGFKEWKSFYENRNVLITLDPECIWSDGDIGGYCTEFYKDGIEIGNIVNTNGDCIDVGFGLDRLLIFLGEPALSEIEVLQQGIMKIIHSGFTPGHKGQGYVLKKLLRELVNRNGQIDHPVFIKELERQERLKRNFKRLWPKHSEKSSEWWMDTHGIDLKEFK
jgi:hypothetical protein